MSPKAWPLLLWSIRTCMPSPSADRTTTPVAAGTAPLISSSATTPSCQEARRRRGPIDRSTKPDRDARVVDDEPCLVVAELAREVEGRRPVAVGAGCVPHVALFEPLDGEA